MASIGKRFRAMDMQIMVLRGVETNSGLARNDRFSYGTSLLKLDVFWYPQLSVVITPKWCVNSDILSPTARYWLIDCVTLIFYWDLYYCVFKLSYYSAFPPKYDGAPATFCTTVEQKGLHFAQPYYVFPRFSPDYLWRIIFFLVIHSWKDNISQPGALPRL